MAYQKQGFVVGQTLTAAQMNHIEAGIGALDTGKLDTAALPAALEEALAAAGIDGGLPSYALTEANAVISRVSAAQTGRTFTFAAITDLHYGNGGYTDGVNNACRALAYIDARLKLDAVAVLGDYTDGYPADGYDNAVGDFRSVNSVLNALRFAPNLRMQGNHDYYANHAPEIFRHIPAYSDGLAWGDRVNGYGYRDFDDVKLRVIMVNTTETGNASIGVSQAQLAWFVSALDLSGKEDADQWQILVLSHHPLDWYTASGNYSFAYILDAYQKGASWTGAEASCNFAGKNAALLIGNIHGHIHNLLVDYLHFGNVNGGNKSGVWRMCTPEACINRANQYEGAWQEATSYPKTTGTADETSFVIYCVDLDAHVIRAVCYGAGYDRELTYYAETTVYSVTNSLTNVTNSNSAANIADGESYLATLTANAGYTLASVKVTMGGADVTADYYADGTVYIPSVTGNIVITAAAEESAAEADNAIRDSVDASGNPYNGGQGWKTGYRLNSSGAETALDGWEVTGFIPVTQESNVYFSEIDWNSDGQGKDYMALYDSSFNVIGSQPIVSSWLTGTVKEDRLEMGHCAFDDAGNLTYLYIGTLVIGSFAGQSSTNLANVAYFRISACGITNESVITIE